MSDVLWLILMVAFWAVFQYWLLPKMGVST